jgi:hypothetical protein
MRDAYRWLDQHTTVTVMSSPTDAAVQDCLRETAIDWLIWACPTRPLPSENVVAAVRRISPLTRILFLTGSWLLAAGRTAVAPPGVIICRWDRWRLWAPRYIVPVVGKSEQSLVATSSAADRLLESGRMQPPEALPLAVVAVTDTRPLYETMVQALAPLGGQVVWARLSQPFIGQGADLAIVDVEPHRLDQALAWKQRYIPDLPYLVCTGWVLPRECDFPWILKPFLLDEFWQAVLEARGEPVKR